MKIKYLTAALLSALVLSGCGTSARMPDGSKASREQEAFLLAPAYKSAPGISPANNIARAAKIDNLRDSTVQRSRDYEQSFKKGVVRPGLVAAGLLSGSLGGMALVLFPNSPEPSNYNHLWYWTKKGDPHVNITALAGKSILAHADDFAATNARSEPVKGKHTFKKKYTYDLMGVGYKTDDCAGIDFDRTFPVECGIAVVDFTSEEPPLGSSFDIGFWAGTTEAKLPDFIEPSGANGVYSAASIDTKIPVNWGEPAINAATLNGFIEVSKDLPETAFIYLAPNKYTLKTEQGSVVFGKVPLVLNQGNIMPFVIYADAN